MTAGSPERGPEGAPNAVIENPGSPIRRRSRPRCDEVEDVRGDEIARERVALYSAETPTNASRNAGREADELLLRR